MGTNVTALGSTTKKEKSKELKKHAATIHCSNTLSLLQRKITNALLYHAYEELRTKEEHEITVKQLCRLIGYHGNNHAVIKDALKGLITTLIEWNIIDQETGVENWTASSILASVSLQGPLCYYAYSPRMKQLLHSPSIFGKIDLVIQSHFRSSYGLALYENCIRYRGLPQTKWLEMDLFKKLMGVPIGKYDVFRDFKRRVLDKAVDEVNTYSDLIIAPEFAREGRKVIKLRFKLKERAKRIRLGHYPNASLTSNTERSALKMQLIQNFYLTPTQAEEVLHEFEHQYVYEKITLIESSKPYQDNKIQNYSAYLMSALKNNYQLSKIEEMTASPIQSLEEALELQELRRKVADLTKQYQQYRENQIELRIATLPHALKASFYENFKALHGNSIATVLQLQRNKYTPETVFASPQIKALLRQHALQELDIVPLDSLEEYMMKQPHDALMAWQRLKCLDPNQVSMKTENPEQSVDAIDNNSGNIG